MRLFKDLKARILKSIITWSTLGKQTTQAKEVYVVRGLVSVDCQLRLLENFFWIISRRNGFIFLLLASRACSMPRQDFFVPYLFNLPSYVKYYLRPSTDQGFSCRQLFVIDN